MARGAMPPLYQMLDQVCNQIAALNVQRDAPAMM